MMSDYINLIMDERTCFKCYSIYTILHSYNLLALFIFPLKPVSVAPPSISSALPVICALPALARNKHSPPKSLGLPILPVGCPDSRASLYFSNPKFVIREGKTPGQMTLHMMFLGASFDAVIFVR
jgi:hypothetical protein